MPGKHHRALYRAMFCLAFHAFQRIGEMTVQSANATNRNLLQWKQLEIKDTSLTVTFIHFKHSKGKTPDPNNKRHHLTAGLPSSNHEGHSCPCEVLQQVLYSCIAPACLSRVPNLTNSYGEAYSFVISAPRCLSHIAFV